MTIERLQARREIAASPAEIFAIVSDPAGHVTIDSSGMLMSASGPRVTAVGETFVVHMDRESLGDIDMGKYDVTVLITKLEADSLIEWTVSSGRMDPPLNHLYGYTLEPSGAGTLVTSYCDWSQIAEKYRDRVPFPIIPDTSLKASLGILARTVEKS